MTSSDSLVIIKRVVRSQGKSARRLDTLRERLEAPSLKKHRGRETGLFLWFLGLIGLSNKEATDGAA